MKESGFERHSDGHDEPEPKKQKPEDEDSGTSRGGGEDQAPQNPDSAPSSTSAASSTPPSASTTSGPTPWPAISQRDQALRKRKSEVEAQDQDRGDPQGMPDSTPPSVRAAVLGKGDGQTRKRPAEEEADDSYATRIAEPEAEVGVADAEMEANVANASGEIGAISNGRRTEPTSNTTFRKETKGSVLGSPPHADEAGRPGKLKDQDALRHPAKPKPRSADVMSHPSPRTERAEMKAGDFEWRDVGSGVFARTFKDARRLVTSTRGGPSASEVARRLT